MEKNTGNTVQNITLKGELSRKLIHYLSCAIPISLYFLDKKILLFILIPVTVLLLLVELLKYKNKFIYGIYTKYFMYMLREHEYDTKRVRINGASWLLIADIICIAFFPKLIAITGMLLLSFADSTSGIVGRLYGKKHYARNRSYAGTIAFFVVGLVVVFATPKYLYTPKEYLIGIIALVGATIADALNLPSDDNLTIPITACGLLYIMYIIFLPGVL